MFQHCLFAVALTLLLISLFLRQEDRIVINYHSAIAAGNDYALLSS